MDTPQGESQTRDELKATLAQPKAVKPEELIRAGDLGRGLSFEAGVPFFKRNLDLLAGFNQHDLGPVPHRRLNNLKNQAVQQLNACCDRSERQMRTKPHAGRKVALG